MSADTPTYRFDQAWRQERDRLRALETVFDPWPHPPAKEVVMTTEVISRMTTTARRSGLLWRHAGGRNPTSAPAAESEHELVVLSRHRTAEGVVTYARCNCGELQIWLTGAGRPAHTLIKSIRGPERPPR